VTVFVISLADGRTGQVEADEITTRQDGSLWLLRAVAKPPAKLEPVAAFAAKSWTSCIPQETAVLWVDHAAVQQQGQPKPEPRLLPATPHGPGVQPWVRE
jgi:hypothetical protein